MTYAELCAIAPDAFGDVAARFRVLAGRLVDRAEVLGQLRVRLERAWSSPAARAALDRCAGLRHRLTEAATLAARCDQVLAEFADRLERARALLARAERLARSSGLSLDVHGHVALAGVRDTSAASSAALAGVAAPDGVLPFDVSVEVDAEVVRAVRLADEADRVTAQDLQELTTRVRRNGAGRVAFPVAPLPQPAPSDATATPAQVSAYWSGLSEAQRWWLVTNRPAEVGGLDGVPAGDRDLANRLVLANLRDELHARRDSSPWNTADIDSRLRGLDAVDERLRDTGSTRAYLMRLSGVDDGRVVVAVGDPDAATDVLTFVPGAGTSLSNVYATLARTDAMSRAADGFPERQVSVVGWLGYDAPDGVAVAGAGAAHDAEPALDAFADGLRVTHEGERSHNTVVGHSYGSLVAGVTARDRGLDADDLVFIGSPGVGVDSAADLGLPTNAVWSSTAANDPVQRYAPGIGQLARDAVANTVTPFTAWYGDDEPDELLWHGRNPTSPAFGGTVFASDPDGGHSGYWQGASADAITRIAVDSSPNPANLGTAAPLGRGEGTKID